MTDTTNFKKAFHGYAPEDVDAYITNKKKEIDALNKQLSDANSKASVTLKQLNALQAENESLTMEAQEANVKVESAKAQNAELTKKLQSGRDLSDKLTEQSKRHLQTEKSLTEQLNAAKAQIQELQARAQQQPVYDDSKVTELESENAQLKQTNSDLQMQVESLNEQISSVDESVIPTHSDEEYNALLDAKNTVEAQLEQTRQELETKQKESEENPDARVVALQNSIEEYKKEITDLSSKNSAIQINKDTELEKVRAELARAHQDVENKQNDLDHLNAQTEEALKNAEQTAKEFGSLKAQLHQAEAKNWDLQKKIASLQGECSALKEDLKAVYKSKLAALEEDSAE